MQQLVTKPCLHLKGGHLSGPSFPHRMHVYYCLNLASTIIHKASQRVTSALPIPTSSESVLFRADCPQTCYVVEEGFELLFACLYLPSSKITSLCHLSGFMWCQRLNPEPYVCQANVLTSNTPSLRICLYLGHDSFAHLTIGNYTRSFVFTTPIPHATVAPWCYMTGRLLCMLCICICWCVFTFSIFLQALTKTISKIKASMWFLLLPLN